MKKQFTLIALATLLLTTSTSVFASIQTDEVQKEWEKPTLVYGESLSNQQVETVNVALGIKDISKVTRQVATTADMSKYLGFDATGIQMFSSVLVEKQAKGSGVHVTIKTPDFITSVTDTQYANAAITAGATDVKISVASPSEVTGESALTGVYKALTANGVSVDEGRTFVAQEEISVVQQILSEQDKGKEFDSKLLDNALADLKIKLAEYKQSNGAIASEREVAKIVKDVLKANGLEGLLTDDQVHQLVSFASKYQTTTAVDSKEVLNQLGDLKDSMSEKVSKLLDSAKETGLWEKSVDFVKSFWDTLVGMFK